MIEYLHRIGYINYTVAVGIAQYRIYQCHFTSSIYVLIIFIYSDSKFCFSDNVIIRKKITLF